MKLLCSLTSPYARKCRVLAIEKGVNLPIEEVTPLDDPAALHAANPLGKVPALVREGASALVDSPVICEFIDAIEDPRFIPETGEDRWRVKRLEAIADGIMDLTVGRRIERTRDQALVWDFWPDRWRAGIERSLDVLEAEAETLRGIHLGAIAVAVAMGYLDFRDPKIDWRSRAPTVREHVLPWFGRDSFRRTEPPQG
jgi:glutathione S-transferase